MTTTAPPPNEAFHADVHATHERLPQGLILRVIAATLIVGAALAFAAYGLLRVSVADVRPSYRFPERSLPAPHEQATVRAVPFAAVGDRPRLKELQRAHLDSFGWVDRAHGVVRIPVERAMELLTSEAVR